MIHLPRTIPRRQADYVAEKLRRQHKAHYVCTGVTLPTGQRVWRICLESELVQYTQQLLEKKG